MKYEEFRRAIISKDIEVIDKEIKKLNENIAKLKQEWEAGKISNETVGNIYASARKIQIAIEFMSYYFTSTSDS